MCGRATLFSTIEEISLYFNAKFEIEDVGKIRESYNVSPTQKMCVIDDEDGQRKGKPMRWGLVPPYIKNLSDFRANTINARAETILTSRIYKGPFKNKRCIIVIDGYYEWKDVGGKQKQPYYFKQSEGQMLALAGLWEKTTLVNADGTFEELRSCTIITCEPNEVTAEYHNRMPVILMPKDFNTWLSKDTSEAELLSLLKAAPPDYLEIIKVAKGVGNPRNNSPQNIMPIEGEELAF